jgi:hypothetical protein
MLHRNTFILLFLCGALFAQSDSRSQTRYLAFQIFTGGTASHELGSNFPPPPHDLRKTVEDLRDRIGTKESAGRKLGFVIGPLSFDHTDDQVRTMVAVAFDISLGTGVAVGFHVDDSIFWGRLKELNRTDNIEWLDWNRTPSTGRRLDWSATPTKILPQLCINSKAVTDAVAKRAALIGSEVAKGIGRLAMSGRGDLFLGVIAGWETQIGSDFDTGKYPGYCALTNAGYTAEKPPANRDAALSNVTAEFISFWARALVEAGVPKGEVYSHIAYRSAATVPGTSSVPYLELIHWTPPETAFCNFCVPGFSTYPQPGHLEQWHAELEKHGNPPWASSEGTAIDPGEAGRGGKGNAMEGYLGNLFNHGAVLVNVFGWGVGDSSNPFRKVAEGDDSLGAYRKFLRGERLAELQAQELPSTDLPSKIHRIQAAVPQWVEVHGPAQIKPLMEKLNAALKARQFDQAAKTADEILKLLEQHE